MFRRGSAGHSLKHAPESIVEHTSSQEVSKKGDSEAARGTPGHRRKVRSVLFAAAAMAAAVPLTTLPRWSANAQILYGGLVGTITDSSDTAIPGATVMILHAATGATREARTNESGLYRFATIPPGAYIVTVQADGFRASSRSGVEVAVNSVTRVDARLEVGELTERITVEAGAATLQTERAEVRHEVDKATLGNARIPIGRNYQMLLGTLPGFTPPWNAQSVPANPTRPVHYSVNGTSDMNNNVRIDGTTSYNPNLPHMTGINPTLEAIEAVNVVTKSFDAEQGLAGGAAINLQIKSGTNEVHGSAHAHHFNQKLSAHPYFSDRSAAQPKYIYNQGAARLGDRSRGTGRFSS